MGEKNIDFFSSKERGNPPAVMAKLFKIYPECNNTEKKAIFSCCEGFSRVKGETKVLSRDGKTRKLRKKSIK